MAPCRLKQFFPDAKFVVALRDPVYRILSSLNMERGMCLQGVGKEGLWWPKCCLLFYPVRPILNASVEKASTHYKQCLTTFVDGMVPEFIHGFSVHRQELWPLQLIAWPYGLHATNL